MLYYWPGRTAPAIEALTGPPKAERIHDMLGGFLELVVLLDTVEHDGEVHRCATFANEHGKLENQPINEAATELLAVALSRRYGRRPTQLPDFLVGPVVIIFGDPELMKAL
jgi:hypothetical protein